jgi:hypothetical protein
VRARAPMRARVPTCVRVRVGQGEKPEAKPRHLAAAPPPPPASPTTQQADKARRRRRNHCVTTFIRISLWASHCAGARRPSDHDGCTATAAAADDDDDDDDDRWDDRPCGSMAGAGDFWSALTGHGWLGTKPAESLEGLA